MKRNEIMALILTGDGINCENETALAFKALGCQTEIVHIQDLIDRPSKLNTASILALPGGFSFGDEIGSGQILALKMKYSLGEHLKKFITEKKLIIGICNGFQALVRLGLLPEPFEKRSMTLTHNRQGHFIDRWADVIVPETHCVWTKSLQKKTFNLPIRHGEGKIVFAGNDEQQQSLYEKLVSNGQVALYYTDDVNGSYQKIAGVTDPTGRILGLMPHPEAAVSNWLSPDGSMKGNAEGIGLEFFKNAIVYLEGER